MEKHGKRIETKTRFLEKTDGLYCGFGEAK